MNMIKLDTSKKSVGTNSKEYLIIHHTGGGTFKSNCELLSTGTKKVSVHYVLGENGKIAKIGEHEDILWHAGFGKKPDTKKIIDFNRISIGIEVVSDGNNFTEAQRKAIPLLVKEICKKERIKKENVLRHKDISGYRGKWDIGDNFFNGESFEEWKNSIFNKTMTEAQKKWRDAAVALNSLGWHLFPDIPEKQEQIAKIAEELRKWE